MKDRSIPVMQRQWNISALQRAHLKGRVRQAFAQLIVADAEDQSQRLTSWIIEGHQQDRAYATAKKPLLTSAVTC